MAECTVTNDRERFRAQGVPEYVLFVAGLRRDMQTLRDLELEPHSVRDSPHTS